MADKNTVTSGLAIVFTMVFAAVLFMLMYGNVPPANEKYFLLLLGSLVSFVGAGVNYFFGSSVSSAKKDDTIAGLVPPKGDTTTVTTVKSEPVPLGPSTPPPLDPPKG